MGIALRDVKLVDRHVELSWSDGQAGDRFSLLWLKDHCPSPQCTGAGSWIALADARHHYPP